MKIVFYCKKNSIGHHCILEFSPQINPYTNVRNHQRGLPMFMCSGLLIASKYKTKVFSKFTQFDENGSCSISKYKSSPAFHNSYGKY